MTPELSRVAAKVKAKLRLAPGSARLLELVKAAEQGRTIADLPQWAQTEFSKGKVISP